MRSDAEVFGIGPKAKKALSFTKDATADVLGVTDEPTTPVGVSEPVEYQGDVQQKTTPSYNGNDAGMSDIKPVGTPQTVPATPTDTPAPTAVPAAAQPNYNTDGYATPSVITQRAGAAPPGWDPQKWANAEHQTPKYAVGGIVANAIANGARDLTPEVVSQINAAYPGTKQVNGTTVNIPGLGEVQVINDGQVRWDPADSFAAAPAATPSLEDILARSTGQAGTLPDVTPTTAPTTPTGGGNQSLEEILASDPAVAAYRRSASRDFGKQRAQLAEQAALEGTNASGGNEGRIRQLQEREAEDVAGYSGQRAAEAQQMRIQQDQFAKSLGFNYDQLSQQQKQFMANLGQNRDQFLQSLGLSYAQLSSQQKLALQQLQQQADQFNKSLGFNYDTLEANQNNIAAQSALR